MTPVPIPRKVSTNREITQISNTKELTLISALKELVASLYREQNKIQNLLSSLGFALRSFNNLNQFLELAPLMSARVTDADGSALLLFTPQGHIRLEHLHGQDPKNTREVRQVLEQVTRQINQDKNLKETHSLTTLLDGLLRQVLRTGIRLYSTPILVKNIERGRIYVFSSDPEYIWTQTRRKLLHLVADQTAVAISNNELTVDLRARERQDKEVEIASEIQRRLLPRRCPTIKGIQIAASCRTANRVGGDYYDFIPINYDQYREKGEDISPEVPWSIVIGDVMGKGVPAGLIMTMTRGMLRAEVLNRHTPAKILQHLNRVMYCDLENSRRFVTLFYSEYDPLTKILSYSNAAHNPPLLWQAATHEIVRLDTSGALIGLDPHSDYEDAQIQLASGDTLIYYTDGLTEAANQHGDRFEEDNLLRIFAHSCRHQTPPQVTLDTLFKQVESFLGPGNQNTDDMTVVIIQVE